MSGPAPLAKKWRAKASVLRECLEDQKAKLYEIVATELEEWWHDYQNQVLTVAEAAAESGYSPSHLFHAVEDGTIANAGRRGAPRIRRRDLPRKSAHRSKGLTTTERAAIVADLDRAEG